MPKNFYMKFWISDYRTDDAVAKMSALGRGVWLEMLFAMEQSAVGHLEGTVEELSRLLRLTPAEVEDGIWEIDLSGAGDVTRRVRTKLRGSAEIVTQIVTVTSRRLFRAEKKRVSAAERMRKTRKDNVCSPDVTAKLGEGSPQRGRAPVRAATATTTTTTTKNSTTVSSPPPRPQAAALSPEAATEAAAAVANGAAQIRKIQNGRCTDKTKLEQRIGAMFRQRAKTYWTQQQREALVALMPPAEEIEEVEQWFAAEIPKDKDYRCRTVDTLLSKWTSQRDQAAAWIEKQGKRRVQRNERIQRF